MMRQSLRERGSCDLGEPRIQIAPWSTEVNTRQGRLEWQTNFDDARCNLKSVHPSVVVRRNT